MGTFHHIALAHETCSPMGQAHGGLLRTVLLHLAKVLLIYSSRSRRWGLTPWKRTGGLLSVNGYNKYSTSRFAPASNVIQTRS